MDIKEAVEVLREYNEWRRYDGSNNNEVPQQPSPRVIGEAIDKVCDFCKTLSKIPLQIKVGGQLVNISNVERCDNDSLGTTLMATGEIEIAELVNKNDKQSETSKINTFWHELTHAILITMGESELNHNEKFVCCFSGFLTEATEKAFFVKE